MLIKKDRKKGTSLLRQFSEMKNILQSRLVTKYRVNPVAHFFLEPKIHLACSDMLSYAPHHLMQPKSLWYFMLLLGWKSNWKKHHAVGNGRWSAPCVTPGSHQPVSLLFSLIFYQRASMKPKRNSTWPAGHWEILPFTSGTGTTSPIRCAMLPQQTLNGKSTFSYLGFGWLFLNQPTLFFHAAN